MLQNWYLLVCVSAAFLQIFDECRQSHPTFLVPSFSLQALMTTSLVCSLKKELTNCWLASCMRDKPTTSCVLTGHYKHHSTHYKKLQSPLQIFVDPLMMFYPLFHFFHPYALFLFKLFLLYRKLAYLSRLIPKKRRLPLSFIQ